MRKTDVADVDPHVVNERSNAIDGSRDDEPAVIEPEAYPQIVHEHGEANHHGSDAPWSAKLPAIKQFELVGRRRIEKLLVTWCESRGVDRSCALRR
jgi:hypothetical protein